MPHASLTKQDHDSVGEPYPVHNQKELPEIKGLITRVSKHEHITSQQIADANLPRNTVKVLPNSLNDSYGYDLGDRFEDVEPTVQTPKNLEGRTELIGQKSCRAQKGRYTGWSGHQQPRWDSAAIRRSKVVSTSQKAHYP